MKNRTGISRYFKDIVRIVKDPSAPLHGMEAKSHSHHALHENPRPRAPFGLKGTAYIRQMKELMGDINNLHDRIQKNAEPDPLLDIELLTMIHTASDYFRCEPEEIARAHGGDLAEWNARSSRGLAFMALKQETRMLRDMRNELSETINRFIGLPRERTTTLATYLEDHHYDAPSLTAVMLRDPALRDKFSANHVYETPLEKDARYTGPYSRDNHFVDIAAEINKLDKLLERLEDEEDPLENDEMFLAAMDNASHLLRIHPAELFRIYDEDLGQSHERYKKQEPFISPEKQALILYDLMEEMEQIKQELLGNPRRNKDTYIYDHEHINPY